MISNFHTHTYRCKHAQGDIDDYCKQASISNCKALGFSDHTPLPQEKIDNWQGVRMSKEQSYEYVNKIRSITRYFNFPIFVGFECEWSNRYKSWYKDFLISELKVDYLAFGPHWVEENNNFIYLPNYGNVKLLHKYISSMCEAINSGLFNFVAHPDIAMMAWQKWDKNAIAAFSELIDCAVDNNIPLEINGHGLHKGTIETENGTRYCYPFQEFWLLAQQKKAKIICNSDAHCPENVIKDAQEARLFAKKIGVDVIDFLELIQGQETHQGL